MLFLEPYKRLLEKPFQEKKKKKKKKKDFPVNKLGSELRVCDGYQFPMHVLARDFGKVLSKVPHDNWSRTHKQNEPPKRNSHCSTSLIKFQPIAARRTCRTTDYQKQAGLKCSCLEPKFMTIFYDCSSYSFFTPYSVTLHDPGD